MIDSSKRVQDPLLLL